MESGELRAESEAPVRPPPRPSSLDALLGSTVLDRYILRSFLARGSMGVVYLGEHRSLGRSVAIKFLDMDSSRFATGDSGGQARFEQEARALAMLKHPNSVRVYDVGTFAGHSFMVMELLDGETLAELLARTGPLAPLRAIDLALEVLGALEEAHLADLVHQDIKPSNIIVVEDESGEKRAKVIDFGLATDPAHIRVGAHGVGTPNYVSPEQIAATGVDGRADLYSLGVVLFEAITGELPFHADSPDGVLKKHRWAPAPSLRVRISGLPESLLWIVQTALSKDPRERFATAGQMATALKACRRSMLNPLIPDEVPKLVDGRVYLTEDRESATLPPDELRAVLRSGSRNAGVWVVALVVVLTALTIWMWGMPS